MMINAVTTSLKSRWTLLASMIVSACLVLLSIADNKPRQITVPVSLWPEEQGVVNVSFNSADELESFLDRSGVYWMPDHGARIPPLAIDTLPNDMSQVTDIERKKSLFFRSLLPIVLLENHYVALQRKHIIELMNVGVDNLTQPELTWLQSIADWYRIEGDMKDDAYWRTLLRRVDEIPSALVLAQAANESAWGASRFAQQGNNLFGLWTYDERNGIIPEGRKKGERHAVQAFASVRESVREYMRNLNSHRAYKGFRQTRLGFRRQGEPLQADALAQGLLAYSQRGEAYVDEIRSMIKGNQLVLLQSVSIDMPDSQQTLVF